MSEREWGDLVAIRNARDEARELGHHWIGCEHLLLGLLADESGSVAKVLARQGLTSAGARHEILRIVGVPTTPSPGEESWGRWTPRATVVHRFTDVECERLGGDMPTEEHLFLALVTEGRSVATHVLDGLGVDVKSARDEVLEHLRVPVETRERYVRERDDFDRRRPAGR